ncbi:ATP-binding protein [Streptomyces sp. NPDC001978]|uniref:ATP-binding protein n=1 Tax=Streptomyces sp. NPDC001978 TaxID=3364627 RepID=UPI0036986ACD
MCAYTGGLSGRQIKARAPADGRIWPLVHQPQAAGEARRIAADALSRWRVPEEVVESARLTVSELVTNAVEHARPPLTLELSRDSASSRLHVKVTDGGPATTEGDWATSCTGGERGRGLTIVDHVATAHGVRQEVGRTIHWADLDVTGYAPEEECGDLEPLKSVRHLCRSRRRRAARGGRWSSPLVISGRAIWKGD